MAIKKSQTKTQEPKELRIVWTICLDELSGTKSERIGTGKD